MDAHPDTVFPPEAPETMIGGTVSPGEGADTALLAVLPLAIIPVTCGSMVSKVSCWCRRHQRGLQA